eukprot:3032088-Rhodomonas_salina.2
MASKRNMRPRRSSPWVSGGLVLALTVELAWLTSSSADLGKPDPSLLDRPEKEFSPSVDGWDLGNFPHYSQKVSGSR